ncbi:MAG TPA: ABC transporter ATP-binding protein [Acidimicrobiia bacterium]|nr:ABC transporter ATP-binding protein [Acidimicrobiia bacterium]
MSALLQLNSVRAGYGSGPDILTDVTIEVEQGRSYCVIGPNGAGKSTMLKVISGLLKPRDGEVVFEGSQIGGKRPDQILGAGICFVPQDRTVFPDMSVKENLVMGGYLVRDRATLNGRLQQVMEIFPILAERASQAAQSMSGGEQQLLALGRALMVEPKLMMVDEPSLGLAPQAARQVFETIRRLADELGVTILMVEQNVRRGLELADHAFVLDLGTKRFEGESAAIAEDPRVRDLYLGSMAPEDGK